MDCIRMGKIGLSALMAAMLAGLAPGALDAAADPVFTTSGFATSASVSEMNPETDGEWVAYEWFSESPPDTNVVARNLRTSSVVTIGAGDGESQTNPDISGQLVAYEDDTAGNKDVHVYDLGTDATYVIAATTSDEELPRISGTLVVWYNVDSDELWYKDLSRGNTAKVPGASNITYFDVDNGQIVWGEAFVTERLYVFAPGRDTTPRKFYDVAEGYDAESLRVHGDLVGLGRSGPSGSQAVQIMIRNSFAIGSPLGCSYPDVFHDTAAYQFDAGTNDDIHWTEPESSADFGSASVDDRDVSLFGRRVAYEQRTQLFNLDIYLATSAPQVDRTQGANRYLTAIATSQEYFRASEWAILCTGENFPDALSAGPLARAMNCPLLLTPPGALPTEVLAELDRLGASKVIIIGGPAVVSNDVQSQLAGAGITVADRLFGADRYATSVDVAYYMVSRYSGPYSVRRAFFARGDDFPDALAVGPVAAGAIAPIILVKPNEVPASVGTAVSSLEFISGVVVGGTAGVSDGVKNVLGGIMTMNGASPDPIERWSGPDRYATAVDVIENGVANRWIDLDTVGVATGLNFPDALGGGAALGCYGSPLVLVSSTVPPSVSTWVNQNRRAIGRMDVFGGTAVVSESIRASLRGMID